MGVPGEGVKKKIQDSRVAGKNRPSRPARVFPGTCNKARCGAVGVDAWPRVCEEVAVILGVGWPEHRHGEVGMRGRSFEAAHRAKGLSKGPFSMAYERSYA